MYLKNTPFWNIVRSVCDFALGTLNLTYKWKDLKFKCHSLTQLSLLYSLFYKDFGYNKSIVEGWDIENVVDLGCNSGLFSLWLSRFKKLDFLFLVDANEKLANLARKNLNINRLWRSYVRCGLIGEKAPFYIALSDGLSTTQPLEWMETGFKKAKEVPFLDIVYEFPYVVKGAKNNLLKLDIEGSEEKFLCLANKYWIKDNFRFVIIESHYPRTSFESVRKYMCKELGYKLIEESGGDLSGNSYFELAS